MEIVNVRKTKTVGIGLHFDRVVLFSIYSLSILIPLLIGKPQLLVGSAVNFLITYSTLKYGIKKTIPVLLLPSITATATGILFNGATIFLLHVMPFIMFSNFILSYFVSKQKPIYYLLGILLKGGFLYIAYSAMNTIIGLPSVFISSIYMQFITAAIGVSLALGLFSLEKNK